MATYKEELFKTCNIQKGFCELLTDSSLHLDFIPYNHKTNAIYNYSNKSYSFSCSPIQTKYFFRHLNSYFDIENTLSDYEKEKQILASMIAYNSKPMDSLCIYLNSILGTTKLSSVLNLLKSYEFSQFVFSQRSNVLNGQNVGLDISVSNNTFDSSLSSLFSRIENIKNGYIDDKKNYVYSSLDLNIFLSKISDVYVESNKNNEDFGTIKKVDSINNKTENDKTLNSLLDEQIDKIKIPESLTTLFSNLENYFEEMHSKYLKILSELEYDSPECRYIRTIVYSMAYILRNKNNIPAKHMRNITGIDVGWAVGDENNKNASFYGNSELAKAFASYYAFMNARENPYTELIGNSYVSEMDYNAIMMNAYFKRNGVFKLLFDGENQIKEIHKILKMIRQVITILDTPITLGGDLLNWLKGLVSSLTNSAATIIDLSLGELAKQLFFVPVIPIGNKKYSLSDIYNYINFIRMICENASTLEIGTIDREEFINQAYNYLGIDKSSIVKIGYCSYDRELNVNFPMVAYSDNMFKNNYGNLFTAKDDLKIFYSLLQFAIQKHVYTSGDISFADNFNYSSRYLISNTLSSLTVLEVFYIFDLYGINFYTLKKELKDITNEKMLDMNYKLFNITNAYDHKDVSFYEEYARMEKNILYEKMLGHDFRHSGYRNFVNLMMNYYYRVVDYNKKALDSAMFNANNISDIDDFFMRFIPSIIELAKTFGIEVKTFKQIASLLESLCSLISDVLFKNLYLNLRVNLTEMIKRYTDDIFNKLDFSKNDEFTIDLDLGNNRFVKALDKVIYLLEQGGSVDLDVIDKCFKGTGFGYDNGGIDFGDGVIGDPETDFDINTQYPEDPDYDGWMGDPDEWEDDLHLHYEGEDFNVDKNIQEDFNKAHDEHQNPDYSYDDKTQNSSSDKIIYENGNIIIERPNGNRDIILTPNDNYHSYTEDTYQKLPSNEFDKLIHIRDFIENVKDKEIVHIQNLIKKEKTRLEEELNKRLPNYSIIQNINKNIQDLTEELESVKNKNRTMYSESIVLKSLDSVKKQDEINDYSYLNDFFNKEGILDEVEEIVINNDSPLTNYQITELLK